MNIEVIGEKTAHVPLLIRTSAGVKFVAFRGQEERILKLFHPDSTQQHRDVVGKNTDTFLGAGLVKRGGKEAEYNSPTCRNSPSLRRDAPVDPEEAIDVLEDVMKSVQDWLRDADI